VVVYGVGLFGYVSKVAFAGTIGFQLLIDTHSVSVMVQMYILVFEIAPVKKNQSQLKYIDVQKAVNIPVDHVS
jgi:hypothetical protein